jgi:hypothetical protein
MSERDQTRGADPVVVTEASAAARERLHGAEQEAERIRTEAEREARQREQEAELLVTKARRLLGTAEEKAVLIMAAARAQAPSAAAGQAILFGQPDHLRSGVTAEADPSTRLDVASSELDRILALPSPAQSRPHSLLTAPPEQRRSPRSGRCHRCVTTLAPPPARHHWGTFTWLVP